MILAIYGQTATGKTTVAKILEKEYGYKAIVPYTTRPARPGEQDGVDYHFISDKKFHEMFCNGEFAEQAEYETVFGTWRYGTAKTDYKNIGKNYVVMGLQGIAALKENLSEEAVKDLVQVRLDAPAEVCKARLEARGDDPKEIARRVEADFVGPYALATVSQKKMELQDDSWKMFHKILELWVVDKVYDTTTQTPEQIAEDIDDLALEKFQNEVESIAVEMAEETIHSEKEISVTIGTHEEDVTVEMSVDECRMEDEIIDLYCDELEEAIVEGKDIEDKEFRNALENRVMDKLSRTYYKTLQERAYEVLEERREAAYNHHMDILCDELRGK